jgi:hypothetical protein
LKSESKEAFLQESFRKFIKTNQNEIF